METKLCSIDMGRWRLLQATDSKRSTGETFGSLAKWPADFFLLVNEMSKRRETEKEKEICCSQLVVLFNVSSASNHC